MKKNIFTLIKLIAALYAIGYIVFGFPNEPFLLRVVTAIMLTIFSINVLMYLFKTIEKRIKTEKI